LCEYVDEASQSVLEKKVKSSQVKSSSLLMQHDTHTVTMNKKKIKKGNVKNIANEQQEQKKNNENIKFAV